MKKNIVVRYFALVGARRGTQSEPYETEADDAAVEDHGEPLRREKRGFRALFIYTGDDLPDGYRFVGYEAGGPKRGPITVATVRSRNDGPDGEEIYPDVKKLVRRNGGV